ncbi:M15 family metallopeptidase [Thermotalea metallivorans]|uniref:Peptidase M15C domain-containing protein n=1 Tax=Thermotalea metallivorans TaxID=520762 RepID=A0A140L4K5_9FIRM|nr:M15 family metallopeptidase [Thermotalea metallivorans]KXG75480.1 hypothetical protein AN619_17440 [Thermotalea metallivorans]
MGKRMGMILILLVILMGAGCMKEKKADIWENETVKKEIKGEEKVQFTFQPLPKAIADKVEGVSWKKDSPVKLEDLSYVKVLHWGFDGKIHEGELIVHKHLAQEVAEIFQILYGSKFPIEKIRLIDVYDANDDLSMADNNTSAFCFREVAGRKGVLSTHSYGMAIDINPVQNPYVRGEKVSPEAGRDYLDRTNVRKGMIIKDDACYKAFKDRGWTWGGEWKTVKDYQHFEKIIPLE